jgi:ADP-L-glycero-D-manno-heptose 6-epimerase
VLSEKKDVNVFAVAPKCSWSQWKNLSSPSLKEIWTPNQLLKCNAKYNFSTVFHLGANSSQSQTNAEHCLKNNFMFTKNMIDKFFNGYTKFFVASSASAYGKNETNLPLKENNPFPNEPQTLYSFSKMLVDKLYLNSNNIFLLRFFNVYGPNEQFKEKTQRSPIFNFMDDLKNNRQIKVFGNWENDEFVSPKRDFVNVNDVVNVLLWMSQINDSFNFDPPKNENNIFNVGCGKPLSFLEVAEKCCDKLNVDKNMIMKTDFPDYLDQSKLQWFTQASLEKLMKSGANAWFNPKTF